MLLPVIILSHDLSSKTDQKQREAREWVRRLEHAISHRNEIEEADGYVTNLNFDPDQVNRDMVECHSQVLWKRPQAYLEIISEMQTAMAMFKNGLPDGQKTPEVDKLHRSMASRMDFYCAKLRGISNYAFTTLSRLDLQRSAVRTTSNPQPPPP